MPIVIVMLHYDVVGVVGEGMMACAFWRGRHSSMR